MTAISTTPATSMSATTANRGRFVWHELMTTDLDAARDFYAKVIGWTTQKWDGNIDYSVFMAGERPVGGLMKLPAEAAAMGAPPSWLAYIEVPDVDATVAKATELGATILQPVMAIDQVGRIAVIRDPQGAVIAAITSASEPTPETDPTPLDFSWHELTTTDQSAAIAFYEALFGWKQQSEFDMGQMGVYKMFGRDRFTYGGIMTKSPDMPMGPYWLHYIRVADSTDAAVERATQLGAIVRLPPMDVPGGDRVAILSDPQGATFAVHFKA